MVMIDPRANTDLYDGLRDLGVEIGDDVIFDPSLALFGRAASPFAGSYAEGHPITKDLREPALFHLARSVQAGGGDAGGLEAIVFTGEKSPAPSTASTLRARWKSVGLRCSPIFFVIDLGIPETAGLASVGVYP